MLLSLMLVAGLAPGLNARADEGREITLYRLRSVEASIRATIEEGCRRSPVFRAIVRDVEGSDYIVYVVGVQSLRDGMKGALLHGSSGPQHLRIHLKRDLPLDDQVTVLAHELQHVREVIQALISADAVTMEMLFRRIGTNKFSRGRRQRFETQAALQMGDAVAAELGAHRRDAPSFGGCRQITQIRIQPS
jgi:hypothetical protein